MFVSRETGSELVITTCCQQNSWSNLAPDIVLQIFTYLDPQNLQRCQRVCAHWHRTGLDQRLYLSFLKDLNLFYRKDGKNFFSVNVRQKFLPHYVQTRCIQKEGESQYQTLLFFQTPGGRALLAEEWQNLLPETRCFENPLKEGNFFNQCKAFPYAAMRDQILAFLHVGSLEMESKEIVRPFLLACYFGDIEIAETILSKNGWDENKRNDNLLFGFFMAVLGSQKKMYEYLDSKSLDYNKPYGWGLKFLDFIYDQISCAADDNVSDAIEFLKAKGAQASFPPNAQD